jgi:hypothetical protein
MGGVRVDIKQCRMCGESKPLGDFYKMAGMRDGHRNECKACNLADKRRRYAADPAKYIGMVKRWQQANAERYNAYQRDLRARPEQKRKIRDAYYRRTFGISADDFDALLAKQGGRCAICGRAPEREASLHLDHHHDTGVIRGILCIGCNQGIGQFQDDPELLERAAAYLRQADAGS